MKNDYKEPFEVRVIEDNNPDRPHFYIYNGLIDSRLLSAGEKMLAVHLIAFSDNSEPNRINTGTVTIGKLIDTLGAREFALYRWLKSLERKGILVRTKNSFKNSRRFSYKVLNFISVWDCRTVRDLKRETRKIKQELGII